MAFVEHFQRRFEFCLGSPDKTSSPAHRSRLRLENFSGDGMGDRAKGRLPSRSDAMTIARHFNAGFSCEINTSPSGTTEIFKTKRWHGGNNVHPFSRPGGTGGRAQAR